MFRGEIFHSRVGRPAFFPPISLIACLGIARNFFIMFLTHSSSEYFFICYIICLAMNQYRFIFIFCCNFHFPKYQSHPDYFDQKSGRVVICRNVVPILPLRYLSLYTFMPIGRSIVKINTRNCCSLSCRYIWSFRQIVQHFVSVIFMLSVTHLQSRFYIPIYKLFVVLFPVFLLFQN